MAHKEYYRNNSAKFKEYSQIAYANDLERKKEASKGASDIAYARKEKGSF